MSVDSDEAEKARLKALIESGYHGGKKKLVREHGFDLSVLDRYYMVILRKRRRKRG